MTAETHEKIRGWIAGRLPGEWFADAPELTVDREEITIVGTITAPTLGDDASPAEKAAAESGRIRQFREDTRDARIRVAHDERGAGDERDVARHGTGIEALLGHGTP